MQAAARVRMQTSIRMAGTTAIASAVAFFIAMRSGGWFAVTAWIFTIFWGYRAIRALEAWNVARIESNLSPFD